MREAEADRIVVDLLLECVLRRYGYDFRQYSFASLRRRLDHARQEARLERLSEMFDPLLNDERFFDTFLKSLSVTVTEMFRDPSYYRVVRESVAPLLRTYPFVKIWHAGCATGEEVYSMAILLHEEGLLDRVRFYATDFNKHSLDAAESGVYPAGHMTAFAENYRASGGRRDFSDYYTSGYDFVKMKDFLRERITFSYHNLVTDGAFGEMNLVSCRNVLIYFDKPLQDRVLGLLSESLRHGGFLCLGAKETLSFSAVEKTFEPIDGRQRVYKKTGYAHA
jgi:chemotaxis protein methyltransferase CheR